MPNKPVTAEKPGWRNFVVWATLVGALLPNGSQADWMSWHESHKEPCRWWLYLPCWPTPEHSPQRAGYYGNISPLAQPTDAPGYVGYHVGGGAAVGGEPRQLHEGTWGWDYQGVLLPRLIRLRWWHGRHHQGGTGQYRTDGPISPFAHPPHSR